MGFAFIKFAVPADAVKAASELDRTVFLVSMELILNFYALASSLTAYSNVLMYITRT